MTVEEWMTRTVVSIRPLDSLRYARELMETLRINQLPVLVESRLVGIVTDRDLRDATPSVLEFASDENGSRDEDLTLGSVEAVMTPQVLTVEPSASLSEAAWLMRCERIGALPVVAEGQLVGILTRSDILRAFVARESDRPRLTPDS